MRSKIKNGDRPVRSTRPPGVPRPRGNPFMVPAYYQGDAWIVETSHGTTIVFPDMVPTDPKLSDFEDYVEGEPESFEKQSGWFAQLSAPGYMDQTEWSGPFSCRREAQQFIEDTYDVDYDSGEELEDDE